MGVVFAVRGTQLPAWYSNAGSAYGYVSQASTPIIPAVTTNNATSIFGSRLIDFHDPAAGYSGIWWPGYLNWPTTKKVSIILRIMPRWTGFPSDTQSLFYACSLPGMNSGLRIQLNTSGQFVVYAGNNGGGALLNFTTTATWSATSGVAQDIKLTWDGTITASACKIGIDETLLETKNATAKWSDFSQNPDIRNVSAIGCGASSVTNTNAARFDLNELLIRDDMQAFSGTPRTGFDSVSAFDATQSIDPGIHNVATNIPYMISGISLVGDSDEPSEDDVRYNTVYDNGTKIGRAHMPTAAETKHGVLVDVSGVGTYRGADLWTSVDPAKLLYGYGVLQNGVTVTGLRDDAPENEVSAGYVYAGGEKTGMKQTVTNFLSELSSEGPSNELVSEAEPA